MKRLIIFVILAILNIQILNFNDVENLYAQEIPSPKIALIRLEDVSPWYAIQENGLEVLKKTADFLYSEGVPFHVSVVPIYLNPKENIHLDMGDENDPRMKAFVETIKYMASKGGIIGIHGYTHQHGEGISTADFEFGKCENCSTDSYAESHVRGAIETFEKLNIKFYYWETPHYTATPSQYTIFAQYFTLFYEPNFMFRRAKTITVYTNLRKDGKPVYFIPTPQLMVANKYDVERILSVARNLQFVSFFFHPYKNFQKDYAGPGRLKFNIENSYNYLETIVKGLKNMGFQFKTINNLQFIVLKPNEKEYIVNEMRLVYKNPPFLKYGTTYLPLNNVLSLMEIKYTLAKNSISFEINGNKYALLQNGLILNGKTYPLKLPSPIFLNNGQSSIFVPSEFISKFLAVVQINPVNRQIIIIK